MGAAPRFDKTPAPAPPRPWYGVSLVTRQTISLVTPQAVKPKAAEGLLTVRKFRTGKATLQAMHTEDNED